MCQAATTRPPDMWSTGAVACRRGASSGPTAGIPQPPRRRAFAPAASPPPAALRLGPVAVAVPRVGATNYLGAALVAALTHALGDWGGGD